MSCKSTAKDGYTPDMPVRVAGSGLSVAEIARLMGVARQTASEWVNGHHAVHKVLLPRFKALLDLVDAEVEAGRLPLPVRTTYARRQALETYLLECLNDPSKGRQQPRSNPTT